MCEVSPYNFLEVMVDFPMNKTVLFASFSPIQRNKLMQLILSLEKAEKKSSFSEHTLVGIKILDNLLIF